MLINLFEDSTFWVGISFIIFLFLTFKPVKKIFSSSIEKRIEDIKKDIKESEALKAQSEKLLIEVEKKSRDSKKIVNNILLDSNKNAKDLQNDIMQRLKLTLEKREKNTKQRLQNEISKATQDIKNLILETSISITKKRIEDNITANDNYQIIEKSLKNIKF